jgi:hypothetical protein
LKGKWEKKKPKITKKLIRDTKGRKWKQRKARDVEESSPLSQSSSSKDALRFSKDIGDNERKFGRKLTDEAEVQSPDTEGTRTEARQR